MLTWSCSKCGHRNSETGTCTKCGRPATKAELRYAKRLSRTERYFPRGLPFRSSSTNWAQPLRPIALLSAFAILLQFLPGLVTAVPDLTTVPTIGQIVGGNSPLAGNRVFQAEQPNGLLHLLLPPAMSRLYLTVPQEVPVDASPTQIFLDGANLAIGQLPERALHYVTTQQADGSPPASTASLVTLRQGNSVYVLPMAPGEDSATSWAMAGVNYRIPAQGLSPLPHVKTLLESGRWSSGWIALIALSIAVIGFALGNRSAAPILGSTAAALLMLAVLAGPAARFSGDILGRWAAQPNYPIALAIAVPALIVLMTSVIAIVAGHLVQRGLRSVLSGKEETYHSWLVMKTSTAAALPLIVALILLSFDTAVFAIAPGLTL